MGHWNGAAGKGAMKQRRAQKRAEAEARALAYKASKKSIHALTEAEQEIVRKSWEGEDVEGYVAENYPEVTHE